MSIGAFYLMLCLAFWVTSRGYCSINFDSIPDTNLVSVGLEDCDVVEYASYFPEPGEKYDISLQRVFDTMELLSFKAVDMGLLDRKPYFDFNSLVSDPSSLTAVRIKFSIVANGEGLLGLITDGRYSYRVVCNGVQSEVLGSNRWIERFGHASRLHLRAGKNLVEVIVLGRKGTRSLSLSLARIPYAAESARRNWIAMALGRYVYDVHEDICIDVDSIFKAEDLGDLPISGETELTPYKFLKCRSVFLGEGEDEFVVKGDWGRLPAFLEARKEALSNAHRKLEYGLLCARIIYLAVPQNREKEKLQGERSLVEALLEAERLWRKRNVSGDWLLEPGLHWGVFDSGAKGMPHPYAVYIPARVPVTANKLLVVFPSAAPGRDLFHESYIVNFRALMQSYIDAAERFGVVVVWPWGDNIESSTLTESLIEETILEVAKRFSLNADIPILIGACGTAKDALIFAARRPTRRFSVIAHSPSVMPSVAFERSGDLSPLTPFNLLKELAVQNVVLSHSALDRHVPVGLTEGLFAAMRANGGSPALNIIENADEGFYPSKNNQWIEEGLALIFNK